MVDVKRRRRTRERERKRESKERKRRAKRKTKELTIQKETIVGKFPLTHCQQQTAIEHETKLKKFQNKRSPTQQHKLPKYIQR